MLASLAAAPLRDAFPASFLGLHPAATSHDTSVRTERALIGCALLWQVVTPSVVVIFFLISQDLELTKDIFSLFALLMYYRLLLISSSLLS